MTTMVKLRPGTTKRVLILVLRTHFLRLSKYYFHMCAVHNIYILCIFTLCGRNCCPNFFKLGTNIPLFNSFEKFVNLNNPIVFT